MKVNDYIVLKDDVNIGDFKKHGIIIGIHNSWSFPVEILFADGINEAYSRRDCKVISDKDYFKLQLST